MVGTTIQGILSTKTFGRHKFMKDSPVAKKVKMNMIDSPLLYRVDYIHTVCRVLGDIPELPTHTCTQIHMYILVCTYTHAYTWCI